MNKAAISSGVTLASALSFGLSLWFSYRSGCAGDLKGGSYGDIQLALRYDDAFGKALVLGLLLGLTAPLFAGRDSPRIVHYAALGALPAAFVFWMIGLQFSDWGVESCFPR